MSALAQTLQTMAKKSRIIHHLRQSLPLTPIDLSLVDPLDAVDIPLELPCLPLNTMELLDAFENLMFNDIYFKQVALFLGALGGSDVADTTRRVLGKLMSNRLAESFNWAGRPPKRAFKVLRCRELVLSAVRRNPMLMQPVLESDVEEVVKKWLRYASGRR